MRYLRTNTAVIVTVGPFYDKTDGVTIETALTITNERITLTADTDAGSAPTNILDNIAGATSGTANDLNYITGNDAGMMQLELAAADVNRLGRMFLSITDAANHVPVFHEFMVLPAVIYDAMILGTDLFDVSVTQLLGTAWLTPGTAGTPDVNAKLVGGTAQTGRDLGATLGVAGAGLTDLGGMSTTMKGQVNTEVDGALDTAIPGSPTANSVNERVAAVDDKVLGTIAAGTHNPQSGDAHARLGAPVGASISADIAAVKAALPVRMTKNVALANFTFLLVDSTDHVTGKTGVSVTAERAIDGGAFAACANAVTEIGVGYYKINLAASDLNGDVIQLKFTGAAADARGILIVTQPT